MVCFLGKRFEMLTRPSPKWAPPQFSDDEDGDDDSSEENDLTMTKHPMPKSNFRSSKIHHLSLHRNNPPPHCDSQVALKNDDDDDDNSSNSDIHEGAYMNRGQNIHRSNGNHHHNNTYIAEFRRNQSRNSFDSDTGIHLNMLNSKKWNQSSERVTSTHANPNISAYSIVETTFTSTHSHVHIAHVLPDPVYYFRFSFICLYSWCDIVVCFVECSSYFVQLILPLCCDCFYGGESKSFFENVSRFELSILFTARWSFCQCWQVVRQR